MSQASCFMAFLIFINHDVNSRPYSVVNYQHRLCIFAKPRQISNALRRQHCRPANALRGDKNRQ